MKLDIKIGDKVQVNQGKFAGKEAKILFLDKKNKRARLEGLKKHKVKTKKGDSKDLHGTFHFSSLTLVKPEQPKKEEKTEAPAETTKTEAPKEDAKAEEKKD